MREMANAEPNDLHSSVALEGLESPRLVNPRERPETYNEDTRLNVRLSPDVRAALDWIAANRGISAVEAIRRAIGTEKFFLELSNQRAKVFVQVPGEKHLKEVIFAL